MTMINATFVIDNQHEEQDLPNNKLHDKDLLFNNIKNFVYFGNMKEIYSEFKDGKLSKKINIYVLLDQLIEEVLQQKEYS